MVKSFSKPQSLTLIILFMYLHLRRQFCTCLRFIFLASAILMHKLLATLARHLVSWAHTSESYWSACLLDSTISTSFTTVHSFQRGIQYTAAKVLFAIERRRWRVYVVSIYIKVFCGCVQIRAKAHHADHKVTSCECLHCLKETTRWEPIQG